MPRVHIPYRPKKRVNRKPHKDDIAKWAPVVEACKRAIAKGVHTTADGVVYDRIAINWGDSKPPPGFPAQGATAQQRGTYRAAAVLSWLYIKKLSDVCTADYSNALKRAKEIDNNYKQSIRAYSHFQVDPLIANVVQEYLEEFNKSGEFEEDYEDVPTNDE